VKNPSSDRLLLEKSIIKAVRELGKQSSLSEYTYDLAAYIALSLIEIGRIIDASASAWEKRGYWLKADRFRFEWNWVNQLGIDLENAIINEDWEKVAGITIQITRKMSKVTIPERNKIGTPWIGAMQKLKRPDHQH
jgi:hypothetical protein